MLQASALLASPLCPRSPLLSSSLPPSPLRLRKIMLHAKELLDSKEPLVANGPGVLYHEEQRALPPRQVSLYLFIYYNISQIVVNVT